MDLGNNFIHTASQLTKVYEKIVKNLKKNEN